jgi:hypothetical protein
VLDVVERLVDLLERAGLVEHPGATERLQLETSSTSGWAPTIEPLRPPTPKIGHSCEGPTSELLTAL